ncbi:hypothetical protein WA026_003984 [Henosepilachna vigintioctopunctata]|uniref:Uncharacterized protein n=1 Tax=Henosepilachna vigintioctopunctata TaxID=420089 RepID=A0AAW1UDS2_9CUCU
MKNAGRVGHRREKNKKQWKKNRTEESSAGSDEQGVQIGTHEKQPKFGSPVGSGALIPGVMDVGDNALSSIPVRNNAALPVIHSRLTPHRPTPIYSFLGVENAPLDLVLIFDARLVLHL